MRKHLIAALIAIVVTCLAALSGCSLVRGLEKDVQVVLEVNGEYQGCYTVNAFNNAIVPVPEAPQGLMFYGWTADPDWEEKGAANVTVSQNKGLIRYDDVKDYTDGDKLSVTLYPVFGEIPRHDIAIAWYNKVATSGLDDGIIATFTSELNAFLTEKGWDVVTMDIVIRPYAGNVGPTCDAIKNDGDIDIMIGWAAASNLEGTGGLKPGADFLENNGNILINPEKARYAARLSETENCKLVYEWILTKYAGEGGATLDYKWDGTPTEPEPDTPDVPDTPDTPSEKITVTDTVLNVSVWNNGKGEWITTEQIEKLKIDFAAYLDEKVANATSVTVNWIIETAVTNVGTLVDAVNAAGNIDFVVGCGANVDTYKDKDTEIEHHLTNLAKKQVAASEYMTEKRYVALLHKDSPNELAALLYKFMTGEDYKIEVSTTTLNVSIWNNTKGEWITTEQIEKLKIDFAAYLDKKVANASNITINWIVETAVTNVGTLVDAVNTAGNIDFVVGCGANVDTYKDKDTEIEHHLTNLAKKQVAASEYMTEKRYVAVLHADTPNQLAVLLYEFMTGSGFTTTAA